MSLSDYALIEKCNVRINTKRWQGLLTNNSQVMNMRLKPRGRKFNQDRNNNKQLERAER